MKRSVCIALASVVLLAGGASAKPKLTIGWRGNGQELKVLKQVAVAFEKKTGVPVQFTTIDGDPKLLTMFISGVAPDIFSSVFTSGLFDYARRGLCEDLTSYIRRDKIDLSQFYSGALKRHKMGSKQYGLPVSGTPFCTWYNSALFSQAGLKLPPTDWTSRDWTWDDMVQQSVKMTRDVNGDGKTDQWGFGGGFWPITTMAWLWGGDVFPDTIYDEGLAKKSTATSKPVLTALQKMQDLNIKQAAYTGGFRAEDFTSGHVGIYQDSVHSFTTLMGRLGSKVPHDRFGIAIMPVGTAPARPVIFTDPWLISKGSRNKEAAWQWIKFCTLEEGSVIMGQNYEIPPMAKNRIPEYFNRFSYISNIEKVTDGALAVGDESPNHTIINFPEIIALVEPAMQKVIAGKTSPIEGMKAIETRLDAVLARTYSKFYQK